MVKIAPCPGGLSTAISPPDCLANPKAWLRPSPVPLPTSLVVKNGSKIASIWSAAIPVPVSAMAMAMKFPLRADWARSAGMAGIFLTLMVSRPSSFMASGVDREIDQGGLELRDVGDRKAIGVRYVDLDPDPGADQRT